MHRKKTDHFQRIQTANLLVSKRGVMSQSDFVSLVVQGELAEKKPDSKVQCFPTRQQSVDLQRAKSVSMGDVSANCFSDALYDFVAAWEASNTRSICKFDCRDIDSASDSKNIIEPARRVTEIGPPKRFYRTFRRSAPKQILTLSDKQSK
jgi:hypothetical protein